MKYAITYELAFKMWIKDMVDTLICNAYIHNELKDGCAPFKVLTFNEFISSDYYSHDGVNKKEICKRIVYKDEIYEFTSKDIQPMNEFIKSI